MEVPRYLYTLFISLDANFQMKCKNVSSDKADPGLSKEWAYFIEETAYKAHIQEYANKTEPVGQDPWECICWRWSKFLRKAHAPVMMLWTWLIQDLVRVIWQLALGKSLVAMIWNVHPVLETSKCQKGAWFYWFS